MCTVRGWTVLPPSYRVSPSISTSSNNLKTPRGHQGLTHSRFQGRVAVRNALWLPRNLENISIYRSRMSYNMPFKKAKVRLQSETCNLVRGDICSVSAHPRSWYFWSLPQVEHPRATPRRTLQRRGEVPLPSNDLHDLDMQGVTK